MAEKSISPKISPSDTSPSGIFLNSLTKKNTFIGAINNHFNDTLKSWADGYLKHIETSHGPKGKRSILGDLESEEIDLKQYLDDSKKNSKIKTCDCADTYDAPKLLILLDGLSKLPKDLPPEQLANEPLFKSSYIIQGLIDKPRRLETLAGLYKAGARELLQDSRVLDKLFGKENEDDLLLNKIVKLYSHNKEDDDKTKWIRQQITENLALRKVFIEESDGLKTLENAYKKYKKYQKYMNACSEHYDNYQKKLLQLSTLPENEEKRDLYDSAAKMFHLSSQIASSLEKLSTKFNFEQVSESHLQLIEESYDLIKDNKVLDSQTLGQFIPKLENNINGYLNAIENKEANDKKAPLGKKILASLSLVLKSCLAITLMTAGLLMCAAAPFTIADPLLTAALFAAGSSCIIAGTLLSKHVYNTCRETKNITHDIKNNLNLIKKEGENIPELQQKSPSEATKSDPKP